MTRRSKTSVVNALLFSLSEGDIIDYSLAETLLKTGFEIGVIHTQLSKIGFKLIESPAENGFKVHCVSWTRGRRHSGPMGGGSMYEFEFYGMTPRAQEAVYALRRGKRKLDLHHLSEPSDIATLSRVLGTSIEG